MVMIRIILLELLFKSLFFTCYGQVTVDSSYFYKSERPSYAKGTGPVVFVDAAHLNYHTANNRYLPFARTLQEDGFVVRESVEQFNRSYLESITHLVIANPLHESNFGGRWRLPTPSAFTPDEIKALVDWVTAGGRLFLIADHMPFSGAIHDLGQAFGFRFCNCFALDNRHREIEIFSKANGQLLENDLLRWNSDPIDSIVTFTGSAFLIPRKAVPLLRLKDYTLVSPDRAWDFREGTPYQRGDDYYQLAYLELGKGKVVAAGEAAMFTAQLADGEPAGMNHASAKNNSLLLLSLFNWLSK